jgi:hypothetical protein
MNSKSFARIEDGVVAEIFATDADIRNLFHPALIWVDVSDLPKVGPGWTFDGNHFASPAAVLAPPAPSIADLQYQLQRIQAKISELTTNH